MSEEKKTIRLNKAVKEFNVGVANLVDFLAKKGHQIENNPNTRLTSEQYDLLSAEFQTDRKVKQKANEIEIKISNQESKVPDAEPETDDKPIDLPKNSHLETKVAPTSTKEDTETKAEEHLGTKEVTNQEAIEEGSNKLGIKIVKKIDLGSMQPKRSNKKSKEPVEEKKEQPTTPVEETKTVEKQISAPTTPAEKTQPEVISEPEPKNEIVSDKEENERSEETPKTESGKGTNFIETEYKKLEGPKVVAKIDLSNLERPKTTGHDDDKKKKRKRIKPKGEKVDVNAESNKGNNSAEKRDGANKDKKAGNSNPNNPNRTKKTNDKKLKAAPAAKKTELGEEEIKKQIQDTLARLNKPSGKSQSSKHNRDKRQKVRQRAEEAQIREMENQKTLQVTEFVTANELATMMSIPVTQIIATCMSVGIFVSINQRLDAETIKLIAEEFGFEINFASADVVDAIHETEEQDRPEDMVLRNPIVTVMGHVDHGKTSLLDYIRNTNVIAGEAGGITQHIGAYEVATADGRKITFLDTPGHEAFTAMRARGAMVTDIAIIVIAADDKIMPQTIEAINHAQAAGVPIVFAINKIDKPGADPDRIKTELANMNLLVEEWGGQYQSQDISAKKGINVDELLEKVILQADIMELKGNPNKRAKGTVLESSLDKGRGYVAKLLVADGTIRQGDPVLAGSTYGRVRAMYNERNQLVKEAGPSQPVLLLGLNGACQAGDTFNVMENEKEAKDIANKRTQLQREQGIRTQTHVTLDEIGRRIALGNFKELNIIVKGDVDGSVEALSDSLLKLSTEEVQVNVIHKAVGQITESDVLLAESSDAIIIGFQVRPSVQARKMAENDQIDIRIYSIIYDAINELKDAIEGMLSPERQEKIVANLEIRETFKISKVGTIAGCMCLDGKINRNHNVRIIRDGIVVYTGKLASLKRFKDDVKEVVSGQDCGLNIENFNDIKVGDIVEAYEIIEIKRKL